MKIHDITRVISPGMLVYLNDPQPEFEQYLTIQKNKANVSRIVIGSHTGTHIDAHRHFVSNGKGIDAEPLSKYVGEAVIVDLSEKPRRTIAADDLEAKANSVQTGDILLLHTGTGTQQTKFKYLDQSAAEWIVQRQVKCVGIDTLSIEKYGSTDASSHKLLLSNDVGIIENLSGLRRFVGKRMFFVCLPLPLRRVDGSPARAVLFEIMK
jgi:arylformamidase